jgi:uncharacterized protein (TIGR02001 family)
MKWLAIPAILCALGAPAARAADWGVYSAVTYASDYRYQGVSESRGEPVVQGYAHWQDRAGWFAGVFATQIDFGYRGAPTFETDAYAGRNLLFDAGRTELKLQAMYSAYPDNHTPGPTLDFLTAQAKVARRQGPWTVSALAAYVPEGSYGSGPELRAEGEAAYALSPTLTLKALLGTQGAGRGHDRTYWSLGAVKAWKRFALELRYVDNDRTRANCGFQPKACDAAIVAALTFTLPPLVR